MRKLVLCLFVVILFELFTFKTQLLIFKLVFLVCGSNSYVFNFRTLFFVHGRNLVFPKKTTFFAYEFRWSLIAGRVPGREPEEIERFWLMRHGEGFANRRKELKLRRNHHNRDGGSSSSSSSNQHDG